MPTPDEVAERHACRWVDKHPDKLPGSKCLLSPFRIGILPTYLICDGQ